MTMEPVAPASSHLPCPGVAECCLQTVSPFANLGADCSTEDAWEGRGAEAAHGGDQAVRLTGLRGETALTTPTPLGWRVSQRAAAE